MSTQNTLSVEELKGALAQDPQGRKPNSPTYQRSVDNDAHTPPSVKIDTGTADLEGIDILKPDSERPLEHFLPLTRFALMDRLTSPKVWKDGEVKAVRRFFRYLDYWRHQQYAAKLLDLEQTYEPFSPDSDLLMTRKFTDTELRDMQKRVMHDVENILIQANYKKIDPRVVSELLTRETHYGLDLDVDFELFEECLIYYRGASTQRDTRRVLTKFGRKEQFDIAIFQRLFLMFKMKPLEVRIRELMARNEISRKEATRKAKRERAHLPAGLHESNIYMKLFKNIPRSDVEMIFPNTKIKFRLFDKVKLGGGGVVGLGVTGFTAAGKLAAIGVASAVTIIPLVGTVGAALFRQVMNFTNTKQRYMVIMAQNLYFHSMADNRGVMVKLTDRAADEDVKEEILLYCVLAKEKARRSDLIEIDRAIEKYIKNTFGVDVDFDVDDAMTRLEADGIVTEGEDGYLVTLPPDEAALHLDAKWDVFLDNLPDLDHNEGFEYSAGSNGPSSGA